MLSLDQAISQALDSRASLRADSERISVAEGIRKQAGLRPNPEFQFQNENLRPGQAYSRDVDTLAMINQPLDLVGKRGRRMVVADKNVARTRAEYDLSRQDIVRRVRLAYWAARGSQEVRDKHRLSGDHFKNFVDYHSAQ
jgi:cobalt-zinc-cadmium efflux system outer membrane protein